MLPLMDFKMHYLTWIAPIPHRIAPTHKNPRSATVLSLVGSYNERMTIVDVSIVYVGLYLSVDEHIFFCSHFTRPTYQNQYYQY
jgi:hypothetical protein